MAQSNRYFHEAMAQSQRMLEAMSMGSNGPPPKPLIDWDHCAYCGRSNCDAGQTCAGCGAPATRKPVSPPPPMRPILSPEQRQAFKDDWNRLHNGTSKMIGGGW